MSAEINGQSVSAVSVYSPASLVSIFSKAFIVAEEKKIIQVKGIFLKSGDVPYNGNFYNKLKDEASEHSLAMITPALVHKDLKNNTTIQFNGFLTRRIDNYGRIAFQVNFIDLVNISANKFSGEDFKKIELINAKLMSGIKDLDSSIKQHVYDNTKMKIVVIMGRSAIIDNDIITALGAGIVHYDLKFSRVSMSSVREIADEILKQDAAAIELICVARGGGEQMEALNNPELVSVILDRKKIIASAIGHADDVSLFEQVSDKRFATPTAFGAYLKQIYEDTVGELSKSKAKMQKDITDQLKAIYDEQVKAVNVRLEGAVKLYSAEKESWRELNEKLLTQLMEARKASVVVYISIAVVVITLLISFFLLKTK